MDEGKERNAESGASTRNAKCKPPESSCKRTNERLLRLMHSVMRSTWCARDMQGHILRLQPDRSRFHDYRGRRAACPNGPVRSADAQARGRGRVPSCERNLEVRLVSAMTDDADSQGRQPGSHPQQMRFLSFFRALPSRFQHFCFFTQLICPFRSPPAPPEGDLPIRHTPRTSSPSEAPGSPPRSREAQSARPSPCSGVCQRLHLPQWPAVGGHTWPGWVDALSGEARSPSKHPPTPPPGSLLDRHWPIVGSRTRNLRWKLHPFRVLTPGSWSCFSTLVWLGAAWCCLVTVRCWCASEWRCSRSGRCAILPMSGP